MISHQAALDPASSDDATGRSLSSLRVVMRKLTSRLLPLVGVIAAALFLEVLSRTNVIPSNYFPPVSKIIHTLLEQLKESSFWSYVWDTLKAWGIGLGLALIIGIPAGLVLGVSSQVYRSSRMVIEFLRPIPPVAIIPLAVLLFGIELEVTVFLVVFAAVWPVLIQTIYGVRSIDPMVLETARAYRIPRLTSFVRIVLPAALPLIVTGVRLAAGVALVLAVTAGLVIGSPGLGQAIFIADSSGKAELMYAYVLATGLVGVIVGAIFLTLERRALHWRQTDAAGN